MENKKISIVTTFNKNGYDLYGEKMLASFDRLWPKDISLYAYYEKEEPSFRSSNIIFKNLERSCPGLIKFKNRHAENLMVKGIRNNKYSYKWDAFKFSHKAYCIVHAATNLDSDYLIWIDSDTETKSVISKEFLESLLPQEKYCSYLGRIGRHSETGFLIFNLNHKINKKFMTMFKNYFDKDEFFEEKQWHDSWAFDIMRQKCGDQFFRNLTPRIKYLNFDLLMKKKIIHFKGKGCKEGRYVKS